MAETSTIVKTEVAFRHVRPGEAQRRRRRAWQKFGSVVLAIAALFSIRVIEYGPFGHPDLVFHVALPRPAVHAGPQQVVRAFLLADQLHDPAIVG